MKTRHYHHRNQHQKGQILLITVMLLAAAVTVVMTIAFNSTTETQITKMEEDSQKALSAAEAALEAAIQKKGQVLLSELPTFNNTGISGEATIVEMGGNEFVTPLLQRDEQYTFYLVNYNELPNPVIPPLPAPNPYWSGDLIMYLKSETPATCPALELTFIDSANTVTKGLIDPCNVIPGGATNRITTTTGSAVKGVQFAYKTTATGTMLQGISLKKLVFVRVLNESTRIGFTGTNLKSQGRVITSEAKTQTGVTKKIELFQSYPQIPSDYFVTSF
jgi:hypothetical protein